MGRVGGSSEQLNVQSHADPLPLVTHERTERAERASAEVDPRNDMSTVVEEESHVGSSSDSDATTVSNITDRAWKSGGDVGGLGGGELRTGAVAGRRDRGGGSGVIGDGGDGGIRGMVGIGGGGSGGGSREHSEAGSSLRQLTHQRDAGLQSVQVSTQPITASLLLKFSKIYKIIFVLCCSTRPVY